MIVYFRNLEEGVVGEVWYGFSEDVEYGKLGEGILVEGIVGEKWKGFWCNRYWGSRGRFGSVYVVRNLVNFFMY